MIPAAKVGHIGLYRNPETRPIDITASCRIIEDRDVLLLDDAIRRFAIAAIDGLSAAA
ncbi:MAG: hypothetical protein ACLSDM_03725 [Butyricicoccus sp.]